MEHLGASMPSLVAQFSGGQYQPNPAAKDFDLEKTIVEVDPEKAYQSAGYAVGGTTSAATAQDLRAARLARFDNKTGGTVL